MKNITLIFTLLLGLVLFSWGSQAATYNYKNYWDQSGWVTGDGKSSFKLLQKENLVLPGVIAASVTVTKNNTESITTVLSVLKKSTSIEKWSVEKLDGLDLYEAIQKSSGTLYRVVHNKQTNEFSIASVKTRYLLPSYLEAHLWQVELLTHKKASGKKSAFFSLLIPEAAAQVSAYFKNPSVVVSNAINSTGSQIQTSLGSIGNRSVSVTGQLDSLASSANRIAGAGNNMAGSVKDVAGSVNKVGAGLNGLATSGNNIASGLNNAATAGNNVAASFNNGAKTLDNALSSKNIARVSAVAGTVFGLTTALSSMATHFLVNGGYEVLRTFYYEAAGEFKPEEKERRLAKFKSSLETFEKLSPQMMELENKVSVLAMLMNYSAQSTSENILAMLDADIAKKKQSTTEADAGCADCSAHGAALSLPQLEAMKAVIAQTGLGKSDLAGQGCQLIDELYKNWTSVEYSLSAARRDVIQDMALFNGTVIAGTQSESSFQEQRKQTNTCLKTAESRLSEISRKVKTLDCESDVSQPLCREYQAFIAMKESCTMSGKTHFSESDQADLAESAQKFTSTMSQFRVDLQQMGCENKDGCSAGSFNKVKAQFDTSFSATADKCSTSFFAKEVAKTRKAKAAVVKVDTVPAASQLAAAECKDCAGAKCSGFFGCVIDFFKNPKTGVQRTNNLVSENYGS